MADSDLWPEDTGSDTSDPSSEFFEVDYDFKEPVKDSFATIISINEKTTIYGIITSEDSKDEDENVKYGFIKLDLYGSGLDEASTESDVEVFAGSFYDTLVDDDIVLLGRDAENKLYIKDVAKVCLFKITEIPVIGDLGKNKYKARKFKLYINDYTALTSDDLTSDLLLQDDPFLIYTYQGLTSKITFEIGDIYVGVRAGVHHENEDLKFGVILPTGTKINYVGDPWIIVYNSTGEINHIGPSTAVQTIDPFEFVQENTSEGQKTKITINDSSYDARGHFTSWTPEQVSLEITIPHTLDELHDVNTSGASDGDILQFNGTDWVNKSTTTEEVVTSVFMDGTTLKYHTKTLTVIDSVDGDDFTVIEGGVCDGM